jgi:hypothetical protein
VVTPCLEGHRKLGIGKALRRVNQNKTNSCRNGESDTNLTANILKNCAKLAPELLDEKNCFKVLSLHVGLRPSRTEGVRLEAEKAKVGYSGEVDVVHCYGHGWGRIRKVNRFGKESASAGGRPQQPSDILRLGPTTAPSSR